MGMLFVKTRIFHETQMTVNIAKQRDQKAGGSAASLIAQDHNIFPIRLES